MPQNALFDDLDTLTAPFGAALDAHLGDVPRSRPNLLAGVSFGRGTPLLDDLLAGVGTGQRPDLLAGTTTGGSADLFGGTTVGGSADLFGGVRFGGATPGGGGGNILGNLFSGLGTAAHNLWEGVSPFNTNKPTPAAAPSTTPGSTAGGYTGSGTASDNAGITGQKVDQFIASKFADSPLVGKGQLIVDYANAKGVSIPEAVGIFWKESGMGTTAGPGWNIAGLGGAGNFTQYGSVDDAIRGAIDNLASDLYRGKSVQDHIGYWFVGPQRYAQSGLNADDGTGGRNGTVGDYLNNFIAPTYAALGAPYNQTGAPTRQAAGAGGDWGGGLIGTPYVLGGLRGHPDSPQQGLDCSEFTAYVWGQKGVTLPWNAQQQYNQTARVEASQLQVGDLVFFSGTDPADPDPITHVGIYVGNGRMINAQDDGVQYADLSSPYWQGHLAGYGRVTPPTGGGGAGYR